MNSDISQTHSKETDAALICAELDRLLKERRFSGAPQMSAFLRYIVTETLAGNADRIKAYSVGVDALGKPDTFDAQTDPSVRVLALRLRKTLTAVYADTTSCYAVIELKVGTYVPVFYIAKPIEHAASTNNTQHSAPVEANPVDDNTVDINYVDAYQPVGIEGRSANDVATRPDGAATASRTLHSTQFENNTARKERWLIKSLLGTDAHTGAATSVVSSMARLWPMLVGVALLAVAWQLSLSRSNASGSGLVTSVFSRDLPTIYFALPQHGPLADPDLEQRILMMLSSRFVQSGTVNVVRQTIGAHDRQYGPGEYQLLVDGFAIDQRLRIDTQIINLTDGEMLYADSLIVNKPGEMLSSGDVGTIEEMATGIVSIDGPLHEDYCNKYRSGAQTGCPVS